MAIVFVFLIYFISMIISRSIHVAYLFVPLTVGTVPWSRATMFYHTLCVTDTRVPSASQGRKEFCDTCLLIGPVMLLFNNDSGNIQRGQISAHTSTRDLDMYCQRTSRMAAISKHSPAVDKKGSCSSHLTKN